MAIEDRRGEAGMTGRRSLASNTLTGALARGLYGASLLVGSVFVAQFQGVDASGPSVLRSCSRRSPQRSPTAG